MQSPCSPLPSPYWLHCLPHNSPRSRGSGLWKGAHESAAASGDPWDQKLHLGPPSSTESVRDICGRMRMPLEKPPRRAFLWLVPQHSKKMPPPLSCFTTEFIPPPGQVINSVLFSPLFYLPHSTWGSFWRAKSGGITYLSASLLRLMLCVEGTGDLSNTWNVLLCPSSLWDRLRLALLPVTFP